MSSSPDQGFAQGGDRKVEEGETSATVCLQAHRGGDRQSWGRNKAIHSLVSLSHRALPILEYHKRDAGRIKLKRKQRWKIMTPNSHSEEDIADSTPPIWSSVFVKYKLLSQE